MELSFAAVFAAALLAGAPTSHAQNVSLGAVQCATDIPGLPDDVTASAVTCDPTAQTISTALGLGTSAPGFASVACGQFSSAGGNVATAFGFNTSAATDSSFVAGTNSRTVSDPLVPGGSSGGGAVAMGLNCMATGDWSVSLGEGSETYGYASAAIGEHAAAYTWGEVALGLYTEEEPAMTIEEKRNQSVIPTFREQDVVLRVGIGCSKQESIGGIGCDVERRLDALRVYKSGRLYLKKSDGTVVEDVAAEIETRKNEISTLQEEMKMLKKEVEALKGSMSGSSRRHSSSSYIALLVLTKALTLLFL